MTAIIRPLYRCVGPPLELLPHFIAWFSNMQSQCGTLPILVSNAIICRLVAVYSPVCDFWIKLGSSYTDPVVAGSLQRLYPFQFPAKATSAIRLANTAAPRSCGLSASPLRT